MTSSNRHELADEEQKLLSELCQKYLKDGYKFIISPNINQLPEFFGSYRPDAVALKDEHKIAIEIKQRAYNKKENSLKEIKKIFDGHADWRLIVTYLGSDPLSRIEIPRASRHDIQEQILSVRSLLEQGHNRAALVMAWSLLEAVLHYIQVDTGKRPRTPGTVLQEFATLGYVDPELEMKLRELINLRNKIVHGHVNLEPSVEDVKIILLVLEQAMRDS